MLELQRIRENKDYVIERLAVKNFDAAALVEKIIDLDQSRRAKQKELDDLLAQSNKLASEIGQYFKSGENEKAEASKKETVVLKAKSKLLSDELDQVVDELNAVLIELPNLPHESVAHGKGEADNEEVFREG